MSFKIKTGKMYTQSSYDEEVFENLKLLRKDMIAGNTQFHDDPYKTQDLEEEITFHQFDYE